MTVPARCVACQCVAAVKKKTISGVLFALLSVVTANTNAQQDALLYPKKVVPKIPSQRQMDRPKVRWLVDPSAQHHCHSVNAKDGYVELQDGCAYWLFRTQECTIVTTASSSHSLLGELFMHCLEGDLQ
jgi:hypothetical protein